MISVDLSCSHKHTFTAQFPSQESLEKQLEAQLVACPICGSQSIARQKRLSLESEIELTQPSLMEALMSMAQLHNIAVFFKSQSGRISQLLSSDEIDINNESETPSIH